MTDVNLVEIFCILDEFCKYFTPELKKHQLSSPEKRHRNRKCRLSDSEVMTILVIFHTKHFRDLKSFYIVQVSPTLAQLSLPSVHISCSTGVSARLRFSFVSYKFLFS